VPPDPFERNAASGAVLGLVGSSVAPPLPPVTAVEQEVLAFGAGISLRLAATLNLRRTVGLVLDLAVPRLGDWAGLELSGGTDIRAASMLRGAGPRTWSLEARRDGEQPWWLADPEAPAVLGNSDPEVMVLPLRARGACLGELTLVRADGGRFDVRDRALAGELVLRAALALDAARVYEERSTLASTLRDALRPSPLPQLAGVELGTRYRPAEEATEIGGDFYDVYRGPDDQWWFVVGDVCGKGVDAAVLTGKVRSALRMAALTGRRPDGVLSLLNEVMLLEGGMSFVTLVLGRISPVDLASASAAGAGRLRLDLAGGGHLEPLVRRASGAVEPLNIGGVLVGMLPDASFRVSEVLLEPGEVIVLYTDGVIEADDASGEQFGPERLMALLSDSPGMTPQAVTERIEQNVLEHLNGRPHDDIAVFAMGPERI
jgi:hypothetical protein